MNNWNPQVIAALISSGSTFLLAVVSLLGAYVHSNRQLDRLQKSWDARLASVEKSWDARFASIEKRLDRIEERLASLEKRVTALETPHLVSGD